MPPESDAESKPAWVRIRCAIAERIECADLHGRTRREIALAENAQADVDDCVWLQPDFAFWLRGAKR